MNRSKIYLGIGGVARSGKDTCCDIFLQMFRDRGIKAVRMALADRLKAEIRDSILNDTGIDIYCCTPEQKETIRPALVEYGKQKRLASQGTHWTSYVESVTKHDDNQVIIVPDVRYNIYANDEVKWIKNRGYLIHVARFTQVGDEKQWVQPPNEDESINDPLVRNDADFSLSWESGEKNELQGKYHSFFEPIVSIITNELSKASTGK